MKKRERPSATLSSSMAIFSRSGRRAPRRDRRRGSRHAVCSWAKVRGRRRYAFAGWQAGTRRRLWRVILRGLAISVSAKHLAVEGEAFGLKRARHGDLHMVDARNSQCHRRISVSALRSLASIGPRLLAKPRIPSTGRPHVRGQGHRPPHRQAGPARRSTRSASSPWSNELNGIFAWVEQLSEVDVDGVPRHDQRGRAEAQDGATTW